MISHQCSSCGGFCKKSGCERENVPVCHWKRVVGTSYTFSKECGGTVVLYQGKPSDHKCICGKLAVEKLK